MEPHSESIYDHDQSQNTSNSRGRIPPQDIIAEKSLLGAILLSDTIFPDVLETVKSTDFYSPNHAQIFLAMTNLYERNTPIDLLTLQDELKKLKKLKSVGGESYLVELSNFVPTSSHAKAYADIVSKASIRRRLISAGTEIAEKAYEDDSYVGEFLCHAENPLFVVSF